MRALFGEVWRAVEVSITDGRYAMLYDNDGRTCRVAVKKMRKDKINRIVSTSAEETEHLALDAFDIFESLVPFRSESWNPMNEFAALGIVSNPGHPNVQRLEAALDDGKVVYLISPFVDGGDIFEWIFESRGAHNEARINIMRRLFRQIVHGMKYNHVKGICHADMSLENALVDMKRENACIIDYGKSFLMPVANINGQDRRFKSIADGRQAKISYCCPETFRREDYDGVKVDVFAAGAMLFIMLTGKPTFAKPDQRQIKRAINRLIKQGIENQAVDLVRKMMAYNPDQRPLPEQVLQHPWLAL